MRGNLLRAGSVSTWPSIKLCRSDGGREGLKGAPSTHWKIMHFSKVTHTINTGNYGIIISISKLFLHVNGFFNIQVFGPLRWFPHNE